MLVQLNQMMRARSEDFRFRLHPAEVFCNLLQEAEGLISFFFIGRDDIQPVRNQFHFYILVSHYRVAVKVQKSRLDAVYLYLFGAERLDAAVLVYRLVE